MRYQRQSDTATNFSSSKSNTAKGEVIQVPVGMWKGGMYCIEIPALTHDKDAPTTKVWAHTEKQARANVKKHLETAGKLGRVSMTQGTKANPSFKKKVHTMAVSI